MAAGFNFFDPAEIYAAPPSEKTYGTTGTIIGDWFRTRPGPHVKAVLTSKVAGCSAPPPKLSRAYVIEEVVNGSLRLQTDYLAPHQLRRPDRSSNYFGKPGYRHQTGEDSPPPMKP